MKTKLNKVGNIIKSHTKRTAATGLLFLFLLGGIFLPLTARADIRIVDKQMENGMLTIKVEFDELYEMEAPKTFEYEYEGKMYTLKLKSADYKSVRFRNRGIQLDADAFYDAYAGVPVPPKTQQILYTDPHTGTEVKGKAQFKSLEQISDYAWYNDLSLPARFYNYDAKHYSYHDMWIDNNDAGYPEIQGKEWYILEKLGLDPNYNRIESAQWNGGPYTVEGEAVSERKATFTGQRYAADFVAHYEATLSLPDCDGFKAVAIYQVDTGITGGSNPDTDGDGRSDVDTGAQDNTGFFGWLFGTVLGRTVAAIGILLLAGGIVLVLVMLRRKKKEQQSDEPYLDAAVGNDEQNED